jgi:hypothetical protein
MKKMTLNDYHWPPRWVAAHRGGVPAACLAWALLLSAGPSVAAAVAGPGGTAEQGRQQVSAAPAAGAVAATLELVAGRIEAADAAAGTITLRGAVLPLHPALKVLGPGGQALGGARALQRGMVVRFAFEPPATPAGDKAAASAPAVASAAARGARRVVLIYVDAAP